MIDYVTKAKDVFQLKTGKFYKHDMVYDLLKRGLPKYELSLSTIDARVVRALFLMDCDNEYGRQEKGGNEIRLQRRVTNPGQSICQVQNLLALKKQEKEAATVLMMQLRVSSASLLL
jgi:hypothetical protein